jgi:hypothetical protein
MKSKFPDPESITNINNNGEKGIELKSSLYKIDVYALGVVFCELATL